MFLQAIIEVLFFRKKVVYLPSDLQNIISSFLKIFTLSNDEIEILEEDDYKYITSDHIKNKNYNYYRLNKSKQTVLDIFDAWKSSNPMISVGGYTHQFMDKVKGYTWTYKFGNKTF